MTREPDKPQNDDGLKWIEDQLRRLPDVDAPAALQRKLLAAVPGALAVPQKRRWRPFAAVAAGIAAAAAAVLLVVVLRAPAPDAGPRSLVLRTIPRDMAQETSALCIPAAGIRNRIRETKPCDVLPPLPN